MTFKTAAKPVPAGFVPEVPAGIERNGRDQPLIAQPDGKTVAYTRASSLGKTIEDTYRLHKWDIREVVLGAGRRKDLVAMAAAVKANDDEGRETLQSVGEAMKEAVASSRGATEGTAIHMLSERRDAGEDLSHLGDETLAALAAYSKLISPFKILAAETFVVHDEWRAAGTFDRIVSPLGIMTAPDGTRFGPNDAIVLDLKTNKSAQYFGCTYLVQQAVYGLGCPYTQNGGRIGWAPVLGEGVSEPSRKWALILHVPKQAPEDSGLYWVDLELGAELAEFALEVRKARSAARKGFVPALLPELPAQARKLGLMSLLRSAVDRAALDRLYDDHASQWDDDCTRMAKARIIELDAAVALAVSA